MSIAGEIFSNVVDRFFVLNVGAAPQPLFDLFITQPPKPDFGKGWSLMPAPIWLRLGGDDIKTASPKASPHPLPPSGAEKINGGRTVVFPPDSIRILLSVPGISLIR